MIEMEIKLTKEQDNAIRRLERAFKKCKDVNIYFHNCYGGLVAYDGNIVDFVNDDKSELSCAKGRPVGASYSHSDLDSWADDPHFIHLKRRFTVKKCLAENNMRRACSFSKNYDKKHECTYDGQCAYMSFI